MECINVLLTASLFFFLLLLDREQAQNLWGKTCPHCGEGVLYWGCWKKKVRCPTSAPLPQGFEVQFSLCCSAKDCRKRVTPPSIRFPEGSPNLAVVVILARIFACGPSQKRISELKCLLKVDERTIRRWLARWRRVESESPWWKKIEGSLLLAGQGLEALWMIYCQKCTSKIDALTEMARRCRELWPNSWR